MTFLLYRRPRLSHTQQLHDGSRAMHDLDRTATGTRPLRSTRLHRSLLRPRDPRSGGVHAARGGPDRLIAHGCDQASTPSAAFLQGALGSSSVSRRRVATVTPAPAASLACLRESGGGAIRPWPVPWEFRSSSTPKAIFTAPPSISRTGLSRGVPVDGVAFGWS